MKSMNIAAERCVVHMLDINFVFAGKLRDDSPSFVCKMIGSLLPRISTPMAGKIVQSASVVHENNKAMLQVAAFVGSPWREPAAKTD